MIGSEKMKKSNLEPVSKMVSLSRGLYVRVARALGCDASYISRVARGQRRSAAIEAALRKEFKNALAKIGRTHSMASRRDREETRSKRATTH